MEKELRNFNIEFRIEPENKTIEGRAIPFNFESPNREGFVERILPSAVDGVIENSDIFMLYNHDRSKGFLARNNKGKGTLNIDVREDGVYFSFKPGNDNLSNYIWERMERGELDEMSFAFSVQKDTWTKDGEGVWHRDISEFGGLYDFSIVDNSYYGIEGAATCHRFAEIQEEERKENERILAEKEAEARAEEEAKEAERQQKIKEAYEKLLAENKDYMK